MKWLRRVSARNLGRAFVPIAVSVVGVIAGLAFELAPLAAPPDQGLHLAFENGQVVVTSVDYGSTAQRSGVRSGDVVVLLDTVTAQVDWSMTTQTVLSLSDSAKMAIAQSPGPWAQVLTIPPDQVEAGADQNAAWHFLDVFFPIPNPQPLIVGLAILILGWWWLGSGRAGTTLRPYAQTLPVATAMPLLVVPINQYPTAAAVIASSLLVPLAMLPLAIDFVGHVEGGRTRRVVGAISVGLALASAAAGLLVPPYIGSVNGGLPADPTFWSTIVKVGLLSSMVAAALVIPLMALPMGGLSRRRRAFIAAVAIGLIFWMATASVEAFSNPQTWRAFLAGGVVFVPGLIAARPFHRVESGAAVGPVPASRTLINAVDVALAAATPGMSAFGLLVAYAASPVPITVWLAALLLGTRLALGPLARLAASATQQRDLAVAATEAERARIAADVHDDALQDLTLLVRRLDAAGDAANATAAREIAERLRAICGDLRLPVLDDLGVGPALEWLCARQGEAAGSITLDRLAEEDRLPADVELAVFRVAQEALSNAIRHGAPPIVVRYRSHPDSVELCVDDSGPGLANGAAGLAEQTGHLGLLNMTQRAEALGASLTIGRRPGGGTRVELVWRRPIAGVEVPAMAPA